MHSLNYTYKNKCSNHYGGAEVKPTTYQRLSVKVYVVINYNINSNSNHSKNNGSNNIGNRNSNSNGNNNNNKNNNNNSSNNDNSDKNNSGFCNSYNNNLLILLSEFLTKALKTAYL